MSDSPLAFYQLNDTTSTLNDAGPYGVVGTYGSGVVLGAQPLTPGVSSAATFPGGTAYNPLGFAVTPPNTALQPSTVTVEAWIVSTATNTTNHDLPIAVYGDEKNGVRYGIYLHGLTHTAFDSIVFIEHTTGQANELRLYGSMRLAVGTVYHVVAVSNGTSAALYINGLQDVTASYPGPIDYTNKLTNGVQIGGDVLNAQYGAAPFPGTIAQIAIYGSALPLSHIVNHFLAGQLIPLVAETPRPADSFVDSIGVNAHFDDYTSLYGSQYAQVSQLLTSSGIRHIRVGVNLNNAGYVPQMQQLAAAGIHGSYTTVLGMTQPQILGFASLISPSLESFESPNEQDEGIPTWEPGCIAFQQQLYSWVKGNPSTAKFPVLGPALAWPSSYAALGDLSAYMDYGNIHDYLANYYPGDPYAVFGGISGVINAGKVSDGSHPMFATETGYGTTYGTSQIDYRTDLRYITRLFFEQFNAGLQRSYAYEFLDDGGTAAFANFGLVQSNLAPKPAYTGVKSLISALKDPGSAFQTSALTYKISGFNANVHHLLLQKRNGSFVLALWVETPSWNVTTNSDIAVPNQTVTLTTSNTFSSASLAAMDENGNFSSTPLTFAAQQITFALSDKVSLVTLNP